MATQNFINECKNRANANRLGKFDLKSSNILEAEGSNITLNDVYSLKSLELDGNTYQQTYTGKNLCGIPDQTVTKNGVTITIKNGEITLNGTASANGTQNLTPIDTTTLNGKSFINIIYVSGTVSTTNPPNFNVRNASTQAAIFSKNLANENSNGNYTFSEETEIIFGIYVRSGNVFNNYKFKPQVTMGSSADYNYEPYVGGVPSPNPSYPQSKENVTGLQKIAIQNSLPSGYIQVDYIESTGTQYIELNKKLKKNQKVVGEIEFNTLGNQSLFGTYSGTYVETFGISGSNKWEYRDAGSNWISSNVVATKNTRYNAELYYGATSQYLKINGTDVITSSSTHSDNVSNINTYLFARNINGTPQSFAKIKLYSWKIYDSDILSLDLVPCFRMSDNVVGLYDLVNNVFYGNNGSGVFTYGSVIGNTYEVNLGKNLFNLTGETHGGNVNVTQTDNEFELTWTGGFNVYLKNIVSNLDSNKTYTISFKHKGESLDLRNGSASVQTIRTGTNNDYTLCSATITNINNFEFHFIRSSGTTSTAYIKDFQIEVGSQATSYSEYFTPIELNKIGDYQDSIKKSTGKNLFDKSTITSGYINADGSITTNNSYVTSDYIPIDSTLSYSKTITNSPRIKLYDKDKNIISNESYSDISSFGNAGTYTIPYTNAKYIRFTIRIDSSGVDINSVMLNEGSTALPYEPYGKVWYIEKQIGKAVLDGSEDYTYNASKQGFYIASTSAVFNKRKSNVYDGYCDYFSVNKNSTTWTNVNYCGWNTGGTFWFVDGGAIATNVSDLQNWLSNNNVEVDYVLNTPATTEITNEELINQLESIALLKGTNNIAITSEDLCTPLKVEVYDTEYIDQSNKLVSMEFKDSCCINNEILGSIYTKSADIKLLNLPINTELEGQTITPEVGVKYSNNTTEYITFDDYTIESINDEQTGSNTEFTAMNGSTLLDKEYECSLSFENNATHTISEFYQDACNQIGLTPTDTSFDNSTIVMTGNPFTNRETIRTVISEVEKVSCSIAKFDWKNKTISLTWLSDQIDYEFNTSDYSTLEGSLTQYGPLNVIIIGNSQLNGENVTMTDSESVAVNGEHQIMIDSPYFLYTEALRTQAIQAIYNKLDGLTYYDVKLTTPYGKPFLEIGNKIRINTNENQVYDTYVLSHTFKYDGTFNSIIESPALTTEEQTIKNEFKTNSITSKVKRTELMVDKVTGDITALTERVITDEANTYSKEQINELVQNATEGVTNKFITNGGNNILRNTGLWFEDRSEIDYMYPSNTLYPDDDLYMSADPHYEYWKGNAKKTKEDKAVNLSGILLQLGYLEQEQQVRNGTYTLSFKYRKLIQLANCNMQINDTTIQLTEATDTEVVLTFNVSSLYANIKLFSDTDDACVIYDLMLNSGSEKSEYSQHPNETTTETVNISKGITITSSDTNTTFKANTDGIRVYNNKDLDNPVAKYTDTGMETNRIKVDEEAQIVQVLWKNVGNNTWISRL